MTLTNQQFAPQIRPKLPSLESVKKHTDSVQAAIQLENDRKTAKYIVGMEYALDASELRLQELKGVLQVNGVTITDVLVEKKKRSRVLGIF